MRLALLLALWLGSAAVARADDSFRCGNLLLTTGENQQAALAKCGPPTRAARTPVKRRAAVTGCVIESWTYDRGPSDLVRVLSFEDGVLKRIDVGDYGR